MLPAHDRAAIVSTGDEIALGQLLDTNAKWIAEQLVLVGIVPKEIVVVPDDQAMLVSTLSRLAKRVPLVIMSGGLGPTDGDLTRPALAELLGEPQVEDETAREMLTRWLVQRGRVMNSRQARQIMRPRFAECLPNGNGTAPGLFARIGPTELFCLPGPPGELKPMFEQCVLPRLRPRPDRTVRTRLLHVVGVSEADAVARLAGMTDRQRTPLVGVTASAGILTIRMRYEGPGSAAEADAALDADETIIRAALADQVFGNSGKTIARAVLEQLELRGGTLAVVESCTGGLLGSMLTATPGASAAFEGGFIAYGNLLKERQVGVLREVLEAHGAVSREVARSMAVGGLERTGATHCLAITGIAGPDGGTEAKPVGTVFISLARHHREGGGGSSGGINQGAVVELGEREVSEQAGIPGDIDADTRHFRFTGGRDDIRTRAAVSALAMLHFSLQGRRHGEPRLLWEHNERQ